MNDVVQHEMNVAYCRLDAMLWLVQTVSEQTLRALQCEAEGWYDWYELVGDNYCDSLEERREVAKVQTLTNDLIRIIEETIAEREHNARFHSD